MMMIDQTENTRGMKFSPGLVVAVGLGLMATACKEPAKAPEATGTEATSTPADASALPDFAPLYPGAVIRTQVTETTLGDAEGTMVVLETPDSIATVMAFYDAKAKSLGVKPELMVNEDDSAIRIFGEGGTPDDKGGMISVSPGDDGKSTSIVITSGQSAIPAVQRVPVPETQPARLQ